MRRIILIAIVLVTSKVIAQETEFGAKGGLNMANLRGDFPDDADNNTRLAFHLGAFFTYQLNEKLSIQPELLFSWQGSKVVVEGASVGVSTATYSQTFKTGYLNLPIMFKYQVQEKLNIEFGPQLGYVIRAKSKWEYTDTADASQNESITVDVLNGGRYTFLGTVFDDEGRTNRFDIGFNLGASYDLTEKIFVQARYNHGFKVVDKNSTAGFSTDSWQTKNSVFQLSVGYIF